MNITKTLIVFVLVGLTLTFAASAQSIQVSLEVPEGIVKVGDTIELRKAINGANFTTATILTRNEKGTWMGTLIVGDTPFDYKYVVVPKNGPEEMEGWANRKYHPDENRVAFNDVLHFMGGEKLDKNATVTIRLNTEGLTLDGNAPEAVGVMGSYGELTWNLPDGVKHMQNTNGTVWEASVTFPKGTTTDFPIKFVWEYEGVWRWETLAGFVDHLLVLDPKAKEYAAEFSYNAETGRIQAVAGTGLQANNYAQAAEVYKGTRNYEYYRAMELVDAGDYPGAQAMYARYRGHYREAFNDDFHGYLSQTLAGQGLTDQALQLVESQYGKEHDSYRKAHYRYLKGSLLLNSGRLSESRASMQEVLSLAPQYDQEAIRGHALHSIGVSYLQEEDPVEVLKAREPLEQLTREHPNEQMRRVGWERLVQAGEKGKSKALVRRAMNILKETGSEQQKQTTKMRWVQMRLDDEELMDSTLADDINWLEWTTREPRKKDKLRLLKADWKLRMGLKQEAIETLLEVEGDGKTGASAEKARIKLKELDDDWKQKRRPKKKERIQSVQTDSTGGQR